MHLSGPYRMVGDSNYMCNHCTEISEFDIRLWQGVLDEIACWKAMIFCRFQEEFEDIKEVIRIRISKKNRQHNGHKKEV